MWCKVRIVSRYDEHEKSCSQTVLCRKRMEPHNELGAVCIPKLGPNEAFREVWVPYHFPSSVLALGFLHTNHYHTLRHACCLFLYDRPGIAEGHSLKILKGERVPQGSIPTNANLQTLYTQLIRWYCMITTAS